MKFISKILCASIILIGLTHLSMAQGKYFTRNGNINFYCDGSAEKIEAANRKVSCVLDAVTGSIEFGALMQAFEFEKALMQEHFNENYVESEKYPKAIFKGTITDNAKVKYTANGTYKVNVTGQLTLHGVTNNVSAPGTITIKDGKLTAASEFKILLADYKIEIPTLVADKITKEVRIVVNTLMDPLNK